MGCLLLALIDAGISEEQTHTVMTALGISDIKEFYKLHHTTCMSNVPKMYWKQIVDLRNNNVSPRTTLWYM